MLSDETWQRTSEPEPLEPTSGTRPLVHQPALYAVVHQLGRRLHVHLLEHARAVRADRLDAQREARSDLRDRQTRCDHPQHLILAIGQHFVRPLAVFGLLMDDQLFDDGGFRYRRPAMTSLTALTSSVGALSFVR